MEDPANGTKHTVVGEYSEVNRPRRLVYSWQWEQDDGQLGDASTVIVNFHADGERTNVVLEHSGLESSESSDRHTQGWMGVLEMLEEHLSGSTAQTA